MIQMLKMSWQSSSGADNPVVTFLKENTLLDNSFLYADMLDKIQQHIMYKETSESPSKPMKAFTTVCQ